LDLFLECVLLVTGLAFGSFLNVCISRIPRDLSIVSPPSFCPHCRASIRWRDNIPVLSWLVLRGRCRDCGLCIPLRYPTVELLTAALYVACYACFGFTGLTLKACIFCFLVVGLMFMDAETGLLPHEFTYSGIGIGLALAWLAPIDASGTAFVFNVVGMRGLQSGAELSVVDSVIGAFFGAGFFYLTWALYYLVRRRSGMGFGDIALIAMVGAFLGLKLTVLVVFLAPIMAIMFALAMLAVGRNADTGSRAGDLESDGLAARSFLSREVPFGVFLGASSLVALFMGKQIWSWYFGFYR
jgi:leader peptidase (prepilin peptidase) / N-methyltransferase